ncbi:MAG: hypothetical protein JWR16_3548 [Nevskia sp.]|nr:hypothetical protein [Nevskia sp.]
MQGAADSAGKTPFVSAWLSALAMATLVLLAGCGHSSVPQGTGSGDGNLGACSDELAAAQIADASRMPSVTQVQTAQAEIDQFGQGYRIAGNAAELGYIHHLAARLREIGASDVVEEPYSFTAWTPQTTALAVTQGPTPGPLKVAYFVPASGSTGADGVQGQLIYLSALSAVNFVDVVVQALQQKSLGEVVAAIESLLQSTLAGGLSLVQTIAAANVKDKIVMYDVPKLPLVAGVFFPLSSYVNDSGGTFGALTPYSRPFIDMLTIYEINAVLSAAGAAAAIAVIDYPPAAADGSYYPFYAPYSMPSVPALYLDRDTGTALKQQLIASGTQAVQVHLTLDASKAQATSYNVSALIPGQCKTQILLSSHSDGPNSIEDNGPAAILNIADYFLHAPAMQRRRGIRIVFTGGHLSGSPGIAAYIAAHKTDLSEQVLTAIEVEHLGAREWVELSPGMMGLDGLSEPQVIETLPGTAQAAVSKTFLQNFDRSLVLDVPLFGEGPGWFEHAGLPLIQYITGPVYLLNGPLPEVTSQYTDYALMQRQISSFVQMILDLNAQPASTLRSGMRDQ